MKRQTRWAVGGAIAAVVGYVSCAETTDRSAGERARVVFGVPQAATMDSATLRRAVLRWIPIGTTEPIVRARLARRGIGTRGSTRYFPPGTDRQGVIRIRRETQRRGFWPQLTLVIVEYGILLQFDSANTLRDVGVRANLTGS